MSVSKRVVPNLISAARLVVSGIYLAHLGPEFSAGAVALAVFIILSDSLDGFLARRWQFESALGEFLDSLADSTFVIGSFILFYVHGLFDETILLLLLAPRVLIGAEIIIRRLHEDRWRFTHTIWHRIGGAANFITIIWLLARLPCATELVSTMIACNLAMAAWASLKKQL